jgi:SAM-dependent methyltransferase
VTRETEGETERDWRRHQRGLFDGVARLYAATRPGYPQELADFAVTTAGAGPGSAVLEVGCGTGQLTERLARLRCALTAIDVGASMTEVARERVTGGGDVAFLAVSFEELDAGEASFEAPVHRAFTQRLTRSAEDVVGVENTRATSLSWPDDVRRGFTAELRQRLGSQAEVGLTLEAAVTMARVRKPASGG